MSTIDTVVHIVDDEESVRNSLAFLLTTAGFAVRVHQSAADFLAMAPNVTNGCLITDLRMPDIDGLELLRRLREIAGLGYPVLAGLSRKSTIGHLTGRDVGERMAGSIAAALAAVQRGASIVRVHDVRETVDALRVWRAIDREEV